MTDSARWSIQWHGKHPMPYDFFYSMNKGAGKNMNWFWKRWFFDDGIPDQAIAKAGKQGNRYRIVVKNRGSKPVRVHLTVTYNDGSAQQFHRDISIWKNSDTTTISFKPKETMANSTLGNTHDADY